MTLNLKVPKILSIISGVLFLLGALVVLIIFLQIDNPALKDFLHDAYSNDPVIAEELAKNDLEITMDEFIDEMLNLAQGFMGFILTSSILLTVINFVGVFLINKFPRVAATLFIILGVLSLFSVILPALLLTAGIMILVKRSRQLNQPVSM